MSRYTGIEMKFLYHAPLLLPLSDRQKVLAHHPDKQQAEGEEEGDDHFKCIKIGEDRN